MILAEQDQTVATDIDDTLVLWDNPTVDGPGKVAIDFAGKKVYLTPHTYHIDLIKMYKERGYFVIAWSANGKQHVDRVITALGLRDYVHLGMTKLSKHVDDCKDPGAIIGPRVFCEDLTKPVESTKYFVEYPPVGTILIPMGTDPDMRGVLNGR